MTPPLTTSALRPGAIRTTPPILTNMAIVLLSQKRYSEAMPYLARATAIDPDSTAGARRRSGSRSWRRGSPHKGSPTSCMRSSIKLRTSPLLHFHLARAYLALGDYAAAQP